MNHSFLKEMGMSKIYHYVVTYDTLTQRWAIDEMELADGNIYDVDSNSWHREDEDYAEVAEVLQVMVDDYNDYLEDLEDIEAETEFLEFNDEDDDEDYADEDDED